MRSNKFIILFCLAIISLAQDCSNPLMGILGFQGEAAPISIAAPEYCAYLGGQLSCCNLDRLGDVQDRSNDRKDDLLDVRHDRFSFLEAVKDLHYSMYKNNLEDLNDEMADIQQENPALADEIRTKFPAGFDVIP